jgi:hypothetical protein
MRVTDGHVLWSRPLPSTAEVLGLRRVSPAAPGRRETLQVHVAFTASHCNFPEGLVALDVHDGHLRKRRNVAHSGSDDLPRTMTSLALHGPTTTYLVRRSTRTGAVLRASDTRTGRTLWTVRLPDPHHAAFTNVAQGTTGAGLVTTTIVYVAYAVDGRPTPDECDNWAKPRLRCRRRRDRFHALIRASLATCSLWAALPCAARVTSER